MSNWPIAYPHYVPATSSFIEMMRGAKKAVEQCAAVKPGEKVVISTDTNKYRMAEALAAAAMQAGGVPVIVTILPPGAHGAQLPDPVVQAVAASDVFFLPTSYSQTHTDARIKAIANGARGATMCDVTEDALCTGAILGDFEECDRLGRKLGAIMEKSTEMRMTTPAGTDIRGIIKARPVQYETGLFREPRQFGAFPDSEVNISPVEGTAEGKIVADVRVMSVGITRTQPIILHVKDGAVCKIEGGENGEDLQMIFDSFHDATAFNLAEFAIGLNPCARMYCTNLEDLGRLGNGHCGIGSSYAIACVMAIGSFTIPMMKKAGYNANSAGAICASAATGGQFMPPVMGAGAFILATLTETPYSTIIIMALVPALLYYLSLSLQAYFQAKRQNYVPVEEEEEVNARDVLKKGWHFVFVLVGCTVMIMLGFSVPKMAFLATAILIVCSLFRKDDRMSLKKFYETCALAGRDSLVVGATVGTLGIIMGAISLSGLGVKISAAIIALSGGSLFISIVLIAVIATIVGMGLPTTASYIVLAILAAPALVKLGMVPVYAHLLCFWLCMTSNVTPPVCVAAFASAGVAKGQPMKTGFKACVFSLYMYLMPFAFAYAPQITLLGFGFGTVFEVIVAWTLATITLSATIQGWYLITLNWPLRLVLLASTVCLAMPLLWVDLIGVLLLLLVTLRNLAKRKQQRQLAAVTTPEISN